MNRTFLILSLIMGFVVLVSNFLVQFPVKFYGLEEILTYGAFSYPIAFLITNEKVLLPIFNVKEDKKVIKIFGNFFKNKKIIPVDCSKLIWGFGAIHCMTQQEPDI